MHHLQRRGFDLGQVACQARPSMPGHEEVVRAWKQDMAIVLPAILCEDLENETKNIKNAHHLMERVLESGELAPFLEKPPYQQAIARHFFIVAVSSEEHDAQGIEKVYFDAFDKDEKDVVAEELWCKASWLSFHDEDASLRFRFSWGMEGYETVSADPVKQAWAGKLCDAMFPESALVTQNDTILTHLSAILEKKPLFVERIVYFNAPNGGAQFHHDVERGHAGVVFAQLSGSTFWLTLAKPRLMDEITNFVATAENQAAIAAVLPQENDRQALQQLCASRDDLSRYMEEPDHELVEAIMDRCPEFVAQLVAHGYSHVLQAGDVLMLPQRDLDHCVWHSVFTLGDTPGEALSFAVR